MKKPLKKNITLAIFILLLINIPICFLLIKSRSFSHLAIWNIIESGEYDDFYWPPEEAPKYFYFEPHSDKSIFRNEISPLIKNERDEFEIALEAARYVMGIGSDKGQPRLPLRWDSPEKMLREMKKGAIANCFHRSILFSSYLSSLGMKSRLWALENEKFDRMAHSVTEVYIKSLEKWVFIDVTFGFYALDNKTPLSFLELRERLLNARTDAVLIHDIQGIPDKQKEIPSIYRHLIKCVFLRTRNDFIDKYGSRCGIFSAFQRYIDRSPDKVRRGLDYLLGGRDIFIHYVDRFSPTLKYRIIAAKACFYFFLISLLAVFLCFFIKGLRRFLKAVFTIRRSKKITRHK